MAEPTAQSFTAQLERLGREIALLQKVAASLNDKFPEFSYKESEPIPAVRSWTDALSERLKYRPPGDSYGKTLSLALGQVIAQADDTLRDLRAAASKVDQLVNGNFTKDDLREWVKPGDGN